MLISLLTERENFYSVHSSDSINRQTASNLTAKYVCPSLRIQQSLIFVTKYRRK